MGSNAYHPLTNSDRATGTHVTIRDLHRCGTGARDAGWIMFIALYIEDGLVRVRSRVLKSSRPM